MASTLLDSWRLLRCILIDKRLSKGDAAVAAVLLDCATDDAGAWPSIDNMAARAGMHRTSVIDSLHRLVGAGYFTCERGGGRKNTTVYWPVYEVETVGPTLQKEPGNSSPGATVTPSETVVPKLPFPDETVGPTLENSRADTQKQSGRPYPNLPMNPPMNPPKRDSLSVSFAEWWATYPKRVARGRAWAAYQKATKATPPETLLEGARRYAAEREGQEARFTKHPATWLNDQCWLDEPTQASAPAMRPAAPRGRGDLGSAAARFMAAIDEAEAGQ